VDNNFFGKGNQPTQDQIMSSQKPEESKPEDHILESSETENTITETPMTHDLTVEDHKIESPKIDNHVAEAHTEDCTSALKKLPTEHLNLDSSATSSINQDAKMQESAQEERRLSKPESENINKAESIEPATKPTDLPVNTLDMAHSGPEIASDDKCLP
jgi:septal ring factor EnvC (AmiA/AmiB activator)